MRLKEGAVKIKPAKELRRLLNEGAFPLRSVSGSTPQHAQLAEAAGIQVFSISGSATSSDLFGLPDAGLVTLTEVTECAKRICDAVSIPVIVDGDTGFGNAVGVQRMASEFIKAGVAGFKIEDQSSPKRCGFTKGLSVIGIEEMVGKLRSAKDVRDAMDPEVVLTARTDARNAGGGLDDVLRRCEAYLKVGVDMIMVTALHNREELRRVREAFPEARLQANAHGMRPRLTTADYNEFRLVTSGAKLNVVAAIAMYDFLQTYAERGADYYAEFMDGNKGHPMVDFGFLDLTGFPKLVELEERYLPAEDLKKYETSESVYDPRVGQGSLARA
ncbi:isocitrate lyase/phosphoenolpyruvate mutase family protein [Cereibacter sp. SYSU M97828]|nr:isocitrate lyase/phosphoenolpyruvate mutase family protein [Cereibacter flavus]